MTENEALRILGDTTLCSPLGQAAFVGIEAIKEIQKYRAIGTVEEFREARERQIEKKPIKTPDCSDCEKECNQNCISFNYGETYLCPTCHQNSIFNSEYDMFYKFCKNCGQAIDWSDTP